MADLALQLIIVLTVKEDNELCSYHEEGIRY